MGRETGGRAQSDEQIAMFRSDFKFVAEFLRCERTGDRFDPDKLGVIRHVRELLQLMSAFTGDHSFEERYNAKTIKDGETKMSMVMQQVRNEGRVEGSTDSLSLLRELDNEGRQEDIMRAIRDESYFRELMREKRGDGYVL